MRQKILITGITGFIGSNIAQYLVQFDFDVYGILRKESQINNLLEIEDKVSFFQIEDCDLNLKLEQLGPFSVIHCAWNGVNSESRDDWTVQTKNILFFSKILGILDSCQINKFIFLGSQAEYGVISSCVNEDAPIKLNSAYGWAKESCRSMFEIYANKKEFDWLWLRVFSLFGPREDKTWLIPSLIDKLGKNEELDLTKGEQVYSYLYIKDFSKIIMLLLNNELNSGVYNVSNVHSIILKDLILSLKDVLKSRSKLNFGALSYRKNQSMVMLGSTEKLFGQIGPIEFTPFLEAIEQTCEYYIENGY